MKTNFRLSEIPDGVLKEICNKKVDVLLAYLEVETVFDVDAIKTLLFIGHQAIHEELERRGLVVCDEESETAVEEPSPPVPELFELVVEEPKCEPMAVEDDGQPW